MKYLSTFLCLLPVWAWAQQDTSRTNDFKLTVEVLNIETDDPVANAQVKIISTEGDHADFFTNASGTVTIDKFIRAEKSYVIEVGCKGYYLTSTQATVTGTVSTVKQKGPQTFRKVFKLQRIPFKPFSPALYGYAELKIAAGSTVITDDVKAELDRCVEESKKPKVIIVLLVPYGLVLPAELKAKVELARQYLLTKVSKTKVAVVEKQGFDREGVYIKTVTL